MNARLIQEQVPLERQVKFVLQGGGDVSGKLVEIGRDHLKIEIEENQTPVTIPIDRVGYWQLLAGTPQNRQNDADVVVDVQQDKSLDTFSADKAPTEKEPEIDQAENQETSVLSDAEIEIEKKLVEIETRFQAKCQSAKIEIKEPDFKFPEKEFSDNEKKDMVKLWGPIRSKYQNAKKINELSSKFGRIQPIVTELKNLAKLSHDSASIKRHLAYLYTLSGNRQDALNSYRESAIYSQHEDDWYNLAAVACTTENEELACYSLSQFFQKLSATTEIEAWYLYIHLLLKFKSHRGLGYICQTNYRKISQEEIILLLETAVYLLKMAGQETTAREALRKFLTDEISISFFQEILNALDWPPTEGYQLVAEEISSQLDKHELVIQEVEDQPPQGYIFSYKSRRGFGFIRDQKGVDNFFHISAVIDSTLREELTHFTSGDIPVDFRVNQGNKGPQAVQISRHRTIHESYELAKQAADTGDYAAAISYVKRVISTNKNYLNAQENYEKWRNYERVGIVPKGKNPFSRAKRAQLVEKDLSKAEEFFRQAISQDDNLESAVNDLAMLLAQLERCEDAVEVIEQNRSRIHNQQSLENVSINIYIKAGMHDKVIKILKKQLRFVQTAEKKDHIRWQIARSYLHLNEYPKAERLFREILDRQPDRVSAKRNLALCLSRQKRYDEAEELLNQILADFPSDGISVGLLDAILQAKQTGEREQLDEIVIEMELSDYSSGQISPFTQFFLDRCDFTGVPPERVQSGIFMRSDIDFLVDRATQSRTFRPSERANYYLSASKIILILEDEDTNRFYRFLCRCFASKGDDIVVNKGNLDVAREWYAEALSVYDGDRSNRKEEQDVVNAFVRFLHSRLGRAHIPMPPHTPSIDKTMSEVITFADSNRKIFDDISYLIVRSRYAARLLGRLYDQQDLRDKALKYLRSEGVDIPSSALSRQKFVSLWDQLSDKLTSETRTLNTDLRHFSNFQLTTAWLEDAVELAKDIVHRLRFDLDQDRIRHLQETLERSIEMCKQDQFEARERLCHQINNSCRDLLEDIEKNPTRISVEILYPVIENIKTKISEYLEELYKTSKPELTLRMPVEDYSSHQANIEVEIVVENKLGCSPAEGFELIVNADDISFTITQSEIKLEESLLGGRPHSFTIPLQLTDQALRSETFSLSAYSRYRTSAEAIEETAIENFTIRLYPADKFEKISNPYNEGPPVSNPEMFYGRDRMIESIANSIQESHTQNKCVVIYGQKRAGKSSIMLHLKKELEARKLVVLNLGNIGQFLDEHSSVQFSYQILQQILSSLEEALEDRINAGASSLDISFPSATDFYEHLTPMIRFKEVFNSYQRLASEQTDWRDVQLVLFIDEFTYIYGQIHSGHIPESFMKNWKGLMQENYFNAVLVGQDVMERFIETFQNEFGITQRERVTYLDREDAVKLIDEPIRLGGRQGESRYREQRAIERILELTAGSPFYIQMFCNRLVELMNMKQAIYVTYSYVEQVKNELMKGKDALGLSNFENLYNSGEDNDSKDEDMLKILQAIAVHSQTGPCNKSHIDCETKDPIDVSLDELVERGVIDREQGHYYTIKVGLFKEWLIANYGIS